MGIDDDIDTVRRCEALTISWAIITSSPPGCGLLLRRLGWKSCNAAWCGAVNERPVGLETRMNEQATYDTDCQTA